MSENKYEQRVRQRAEELAREVFPVRYENRGKHYSGKYEWGKALRDFTPAARLSVQREAEAYVKGRSAGYDLGIAWEKGESIVVTPNFELQSLGLVSENEPGNDPGKI